MKTHQITFPEFSGIRCLMMPYIQGEPDSIPETYLPYREIIGSVFLEKGSLGFLTIDESPVLAGQPHRGKRARYGRSLHTEVGRDPNTIYCWGGGGWHNPPHRVTLEREVEILLANNLDDSCAVWNVEHEDTSLDGDIGDVAHLYPYDAATFLKSGEVHKIGILTPHESVPVQGNFDRQFLRIVGAGVHGREDYFTKNELVPFH
jgi:hypothetical protein